jgi:hypothetical protein
MSDFGGSRVGSIVRLLGNLRGIFGGRTASNLSRALSALRSVVDDVGQETANYFSENGSFLSKFVGALRRFWGSGLLPLLRWLRTKFTELRNWLKRMGAPIFRLLDRLRREWLHFYQRFLRPILDTIAAIRFALGILERFHVAWAQKADDFLAEVESWISRRFLEVLGFINRLEDRVYRVITLDYLIERLALLRSLDRDAPRWIRMWWNKQLAAVKPAAHAPGRGPKYSRRPPAVDAAELKEFFTTRGGPRAPVIEELSATFRIALGVAPRLEADE